jgi:hypothetical protein
MSATRLDSGGFAIDPAELFRVFAPQPPEQRRERRRERQEATANSAVLPLPATPATPPADELALKVAALDAEIRGLKELLAEVRVSRDGWQARADEWKSQATRLTLALPAPAPGPVAAPPPKRPWWRRLAG